MICFIRNRDNYTLHKRLPYFLVSAFGRAGAGGEACAIYRPKGKQWSRLLCHLIGSTALLFVLFHSKSVAQESRVRGTAAATEIQALQVGDTIPEKLWNMPLKVVNHPEGKETITLNDYRDKKLIILDFWATWCKSCIEGFPNLSRLKQEYPEEFDVLLVNTVQTKDSPNRVQQFLSKYKKAYDYKLDLAYQTEDTLFLKLFQHKILPHVVWLDGDLRFIGSSHGYEVTKKNIDNFLEYGRTDFFQKNDYDSLDSLDISDDEIKIARFRRYQDGLRSKTLQRTVLENQSSYTIINKPLSYMIDIACDTRTLPKSLWVFPSDEQGRKLRHQILEFSLNPSTDYYCYYLGANMKIGFTNFQQNLLHDIEDFIGYEVLVKKEATEVRILTPTNNLKEFKTKGGILQLQTKVDNLPMFLQNVHITALEAYLANLFRSPTVVGKHNIDVFVDLSLLDNLYDMDDRALEKFARSIGFDIKYDTKVINTVQFIAK